MIEYNLGKIIYVKLNIKPLMIRGVVISSDLGSDERSTLLGFVPS